MFCELDPDSNVPLFQQLHDQLISSIASGDLSDGSQLEPVRKVATAFGINPATVKKAYDLLRAEGLLDSRNRARSVVHVPPVAKAEHIETFQREVSLLVDKARCQGMSEAQIEEILWNCCSARSSR